MTRAIHFTHHSCGAPPNNRYVSGPFTGCGSAHPRGQRRSQIAFTTDQARVTCKSCKRVLTTKRVFTNGFYGPAECTDHREMIKRAWQTCCRDRGAALPFSEDERIACERELIEDAVSKIWRANVALAGLALRSSGIGKEEIDVGTELAGVMREQAEKIATLLADRPALASAMQPALAEWLLAAEWYDQVAECSARADRIVEDVLAGIRSGEISHERIEAGELDGVQQGESVLVEAEAA